MESGQAIARPPVLRHDFANHPGESPKFDTTDCKCDNQAVKTSKVAVAERKTRGTIIMEKYRPRLNRLTPAQRQRLRNRAMQIAFGHESESAPTSRR